MGLLQKDGTVIRKINIPKIYSGKITAREENSIEEIKPMDIVEKETIESAIIICRGNAKLAAEKLHISYGCIRDKIAQYKVKAASNGL